MKRIKNKPNGRKSLLEPNAVRQRRVDVDKVESPSDNRNHQNDDRKDESEPKSRFAHGLDMKHFVEIIIILHSICNDWYLGERPDVRSANDEIVEILEGKIQDERTPDGYVIEDGPVGRVQGDLNGDDDDEDCGHNAANQLMIGRRVPLLRGAVKIGACHPLRQITSLEKNMTTKRNKEKRIKGVLNVLERRRGDRERNAFSRDQLESKEEECKNSINLWRSGSLREREFC